MQYLLVLDALNFCFWPEPGLEYEHLAASLKARPRPVLSSAVGNDVANNAGHVAQSFGLETPTGPFEDFWTE